MKWLFSKEFEKSSKALGPEGRKQLQSALGRQEDWLSSKGAHLEPLGNGDAGWWSFRINDDYRVIVAKLEEGLFLARVDTHESAYRWVDRHRFSRNAVTREMQVYQLPESPRSKSDGGPFRLLSDMDLLYFGVPAELHEYVRGLSGFDDIDSDYLPENALENLAFYADDEVPRYQVYENARLYNEQCFDDGGKSQTGSLVRVSSEDELSAALGSSFEEWQIFLHPSQYNIVFAHYPGSAKVTGGAGTGKTVVALHRAKYLANQLVNPHDRVLLTVFNTGLKTYVEKQLKKLCGEDSAEYARIEVENIDRLAQMVFDAAGVSPKRMADGKERKAWKRAIQQSECGNLTEWRDEWNESFLSEEWNRVILQNDIRSFEEYRDAKRTGRGKRLSKEDRKLIWAVVERYRKTAEDEGTFDNQHFLQKAADLLASLDEGDPKRLRFQHVIVDEMQDMSAPALRLIRSIAGHEHANDIMVLGDSRQHIYAYKGSLKSCGIIVRPPSSTRLHRNYRTTGEIEEYARSVLGDVWLQGAEDEAESERSVSLISGEKPTVAEFNGEDAETEFIVEKIRELRMEGVPAEAICVMASTNKRAEKYRDLIVGRGQDAQLLQANSITPKAGHISVSTMHHAKGLEYDAVFLADLSQDNVPSKIYSGGPSEIERQKDLGYPIARSLLYMGITRAKQRVYITSPSKLSELLPRTPHESAQED